MRAWVRDEWILGHAKEFCPGKFYVQFPPETAYELPVGWVIKFSTMEVSGTIVLVEAGPLDGYKESWLQRNEDNLRVAADILGRVVRRVLLGEFGDGLSP